MLGRRAIAGDNLDVHSEQIKQLVRVATSDANDPADRISALIFNFSLPENIQEQIAMRLGDKFSLKEVVACANSIWS